MDPTFLTAAEWSETGQILRFFWGTLLFIIGFAGNLLVAHAVIPSLVGTGHLPRGVLSARPLLYLVAFACLAVAAYFFSQMVGLREVFGVIYPSRWWM